MSRWLSSPHVPLREITVSRFNGLVSSGALGLALKPSNLASFVVVNICNMYKCRLWHQPKNWTERTNVLNKAKILWVLKMKHKLTTTTIIIIKSSQRYLCKCVCVCVCSYFLIYFGKKTAIFWFWSMINHIISHFHPALIKVTYSWTGNNVLFCLFQLEVWLTVWGRNLPTSAYHSKPIVLHFMQHFSWMRDTILC